MKYSLTEEQFLKIEERRREERKKANEIRKELVLFWTDKKGNKYKVVVKPNNKHYYAYLRLYLEMQEENKKY